MMTPPNIEKSIHDPKELISKLSSANSEGLQFEKIPVEGYEQVLKVTDKKAKLTAIISIHNTSLGPALGGTRIQAYSSFEAALEDALRLSKGMTYKSAIAEAGFGGEKVSSSPILKQKKHLNFSSHLVLQWKPLEASISAPKTWAAQQMMLKLLDRRLNTL